MQLAETVNRTLAQTIKRLSEKYRIPAKDFRLMIMKHDGILKYVVLDKTEKKGIVSLKEAIGQNGAINLAVGMSLKRAILNFEKECKTENIDLKILTETDDYAPRGVLFANRKAKRYVKTEELI